MAEANASQPPPEDDLNRAAAIATAIFPGVIVHGTGHWVRGEPQTARRLLYMEGAGIGLILLGGIPIVLSGASRRLVGPAAALVASGVGFFGISMLADLYGVAAPEGGTGQPQRWAPFIETRLGYRYVYDPQFSYRSFLFNGIDLRWQAFRLAPATWWALDDKNARVRLLGAYRLAGPRPDRRARDGSFADVEVGTTHHRFGSEHFRTTTVEAFVNGRLDMGRIGRTLRGSFAEMGVGWALQTFDYDLVRGDPDLDVEDLLLARHGYGVYLGGPERAAGEVFAYYDHRHDDFAAGLKLPGLGSGVAGHFGLAASAYFGEFGLALELEAGSAYVVGLSFAMRRKREQE